MRIWSVKFIPLCELLCECFHLFHAVQTVMWFNGLRCNSANGLSLFMQQQHKPDNGVAKLECGMSEKALQNAASIDHIESAHADTRIISLFFAHWNVSACKSVDLGGHSRFVSHIQWAHALEHHCFNAQMHFMASKSKFR